MKWIFGFIFIFILGKLFGKNKNNDKDDSGRHQFNSSIFNMEQKFKKERIETLKKEQELINKRIEIEKILINKMEDLIKKRDKTPVEHIAEAKAKADVLSVQIYTAKGRKKTDLEFKRSQEVENQKYWIRRILD
jgi:hypothetical protein